MKKMAQVKREHPEVSAIISAVIRRVGMDSVEDINNHGIAGGFSGFTYYSDTVAFWRKYKADILAMLKEDAAAFGQSIAGMILCFPCLNKEFDEDEIGAALYGKYNDNYDIVYNALAWYAAETVCRWFEE